MVALVNHAVQKGQMKHQEENNGGHRSNKHHSGVGGAQAQSVATHTSEPHIHGAAKNAAPSVSQFKVDLPKSFNGKTLDGTALESCLY